MTIDGKIRDEELQYDISREAAKISALSFGKTDEYEYCTGEGRRVIGQAKFTYSTLGETLEKQEKTIEYHGIKQVEALKSLKPKESQELESIDGTYDIENKIDEIRKWEEKI